MLVIVIVLDLLSFDYEHGASGGRALPGFDFDYEPGRSTSKNKNKNKRKRKRKGLLTCP